MELLTITHTDFTMSIECNKFDAIWNKARNNIGEQGLLSVIPGLMAYCQSFAMQKARTFL